MKTTEEINKEVLRIKARRSLSVEDYEMLEKYYDVTKHDVMNTSIRPDRPKMSIEMDEDTDKEKEVFNGVHKVNRVVYPVIQDIIGKAVSFATGNPLDVTYSEGYDKDVNKIEDVMKANKQQALNAKACESMFAFREVAEIWYFDEEDQKIRCHTVSPMLGDTLYPEIDRLGRMQSFAYSNSFEDDNGDKVEEIVHYTKDFIKVYQSNGKDFILEKEIKWSWNKIPVAYHNQGKADYENVIQSINRVERASSNLADSVDDSAFPDKLFKGKFQGQVETPGKGGKYITSETGDIKVIESAQGSNLIDLDLKNNKTIINTFTQTPDLSMEALKGLGSGLSGETLKRMLTGAILKVQSKRSYLDEFFTRRYNIVKALTGADEKLTIDVKVIPYLPKDIDADIDRLIKMSAFMPKRYIVEEFKRLINPSIDVDEVMEWFKEDQDFDFGGSLMVETQEV